MPKERRVKAEKGTILWASMMLMAAGTMALIEREYLHGAVLVLISLVLTYLREHLKFGRWAETSYWRGKRIARG